MESFVERWYTDGDRALDVWFVHAIARFEVRAGDEVLFSSTQFVDVLRWCMHDETPAVTLAEAIDLSPLD